MRVSSVDVRRPSRGHGSTEGEVKEEEEKGVLSCDARQRLLLRPQAMTSRGARTALR